MTARITLAIGAATAALATAPAVSAQEMNYEERVFEYAEPLPDTADDIEFRSDPVIQPVPAPARRTAPASAPPVRQVRYVKDRTHAPVHHAAPHQTHAEPVRTREIVYETERVVSAPHHAAPHHAAPHHTAPHHAAPMHHAPAPPHAGMQHHAPAYAPPQPTFDRDAWLDDCRDRLGGDRRGDGGIIGGLLGAVAGGVIGNRVYDSERLAGTLIGAGVGGLAGLAIGSVISGSGRDRDLDECEAYLERWEYQQRGGAYPARGYDQGYYQPYGYTLVPVTVAVPQRAVVREYVTTEVYTDHEEVIVETTTHYAPAPAPRPVKRQRYIKGK